MPTRLKINLPRGMILSATALLALIDFACTSSRLANVWKDPEYRNPPMTSMLVIASKKNPVNRRLWEDVISAELSAHGVRTTPSYRLFADSIPNPDQAGAAIRERKFDGVLFIRRLKTEISTNNVPGYVKTEAVTKYDKRKQTYVTTYRDVQQPGYTDTTRIVRHEINVFAAKEGERLIWAGTGEMIDPGSREAVKDEITSLVVPELARQGIIPAK